MDLFIIDLHYAGLKSLVGATFHRTQEPTPFPYSQCCCMAFWSSYIPDHVALEFSDLLDHNHQLRHEYTETSLLRVFLHGYESVWLLPTMAVHSLRSQNDGGIGVLVVLFLWCFQHALAQTGSVYQLDSEYSGTNFFDGWDFFTVCNFVALFEGSSQTSARKRRLTYMHLGRRSDRWIRHVLQSFIGATCWYDQLQQFATDIYRLRLYDSHREPERRRQTQRENIDQTVMDPWLIHWGFQSLARWDLRDVAGM